MAENFRIPPAPIYSFEEMMEIAEAMERLGATMDKIREKEKKENLLHHGKTKGSEKKNLSDLVERK